jgi:hypothetical protein
MSRNSGILEVIWFVIGGLMMFIAVDSSLEKGFSESWYYFIFSIMALSMYFMRRRNRLSKK